MTHKIAAATKQVDLDPTPANNSFEDQLTRILTRLPPIIRLPKPGQRCPHCQLSRTGLLDLIAPTARNGRKPPVEAIYQRANRYAERGIWLIPTENLFRHLLSLGGSAMAEHERAEKLRRSTESGGTEDGRTDVGNHGSQAKGGRS